MSNYLNTIYNSLYSMLLASNFPVRMRKFTELGERDASKTVYMNGYMHLQDVMFYGRPLLLLHDQEPLLYRCQKPAYEKLFNDVTQMENRMMILTSERNSQELSAMIADYGIIPVHFFSNGVLASEWYANDRWRLDQSEDDVIYTFSCFNRLIEDRMHRPILSSYLASKVNHSKLMVSCNVTDPYSGKHISACSHGVAPRHRRYIDSMGHEPMLINIPPEDLRDGTIRNASAESLSRMIYTSFCHVVTETLFYQKAVHLTEKSLRPMVNRRPFLLAGPAGSLAYLRSYGFRTFSDWWDESYDLIEDPHDRLDCIMMNIDKISSWSNSKIKSVLLEMRPVLEHNHNHFYTDFPEIIMQELKDNMSSAMQLVKERPINSIILRTLHSMSSDEFYNLMYETPRLPKRGTWHDVITRNDEVEIKDRACEYCADLYDTKKDKISKQQLLANLLSMSNQSSV